MSKRKPTTFLIICCSLASLISFVGCKKQNKQTEKRTFPAVTVPTIYTSQQARAEYLALHYWDQFDFNDTAYVGSAALLTQQALLDYLSVLPYASYPIISEGLKNILEKADQNTAMYAFFSSHLENFLFAPNSSLRNEEFYIPVLEHMVTAKSLDEHRKMRPKENLAQLNKNRPGTQATNIRYTLPNGAVDSLSTEKTDYTLLLFYNLDCGNCKEVIAAIEASKHIIEMQKRNRLRIMAIYPGQDVEAWKEYLKQIPPSWKTGYDHLADIWGKGTYVLRNLPTLYLIDKNQTIIIKDAPLQYIEYYFNSILHPPTGNKPEQNGG